MFKYFESLINPYPGTRPLSLPKGLFSFMWQVTDGTRGFMSVMMLCSILFGAFEALLFAILGKMVDWLADIEPAQLFAQEGGTLALLTLFVFSSIAVVLLGTLVKHQTIAGNFPMRLRWNFHRMMLNQSMHFFQDEFSGRISAKVMQTALAVRDVCMIVVDIFAYISVYFVALLFVVGSFDPWMLIPFVTWLICYGFAMYYFVPRLGKVAKSQADARSLMTGRITDAYTNIATVKLFSHAGRESGYARSAMQEFLVTVNRQMRLVSGVEIVNQVLSIGLLVATAAIALYLWSKGQVGVGALAAASAMALRLNGLSHWIMWEMTALFENIGTVQDGINMLTVKREVADKPDAYKLAVPQGRVDFKHVSFFYEDKEDEPVIENMNLTIRAGEKIGLVGRSGAGKSTLVNLLLRFYDVQKGAIVIDNQNIADVTQESLRSHIGMVTQDTSLLHRSVRDNILYGRPDASEEEMVEAAKRAQAHDFIMTLTDSQGRQGYDVHVGERGVKLSGGQRQRIAIARVMLKDAPILLLDEATSALDSEVENAIQDSLYKLMEGKTVVAIAHRLSTIAEMDRLIVLDKGRIVEEGDHQTLLDNDGLYAHLWKHQSGGFLADH